MSRNIIIKLLIVVECVTNQLEIKTIKDVMKSTYFKFKAEGV